MGCWRVFSASLHPAVYLTCCAYPAGLSMCPVLGATGVAIVEGTLLDARRRGPVHCRAKRPYGWQVLSAVVMVAWGWQVAQVVAQVRTSLEVRFLEPFVNFVYPTRL